MINNTRNVWQPPVAKHCSITACLLTTTNPHPPAAAAVAAAPHKCLHGPSDGALIVNAHTRPHPPTAPRHRRPPPSVDIPPRLPLPPSRDVGKRLATSPLQPPAASLAANGDPQPPRHRWNSPRTPRHSRRRPPPATLPSKSSVYAMSRTTTTGWRGVRSRRRSRRSGGDEWSGRGWTRGSGKGKSRGDREEDGGQHLLPPFRVVSNGGSVCCPISLYFERGQHTLPPFLFVPNGGSKCCPLFSLLTAGGGREGGHECSPPAVGPEVSEAACNPHAASFELLYSTPTGRFAVSITGRRHTTRRPRFPAFTVPTTGFSSCGVNDDNRAACNLHAALFNLVYPPRCWGDFLRRRQRQRGGVQPTHRPRFLSFPPGVDEDNGVAWYPHATRVSLRFPPHWHWGGFGFNNRAAW